MTETLVSSTARVLAVLEAGKNASPQTGSISETAIDTVLLGLDNLVEGYLGRRLKSEARTLVVDRVRRGALSIRLSAFPVDAVATFEVRQSHTRDFSDDSTIVPASQYHVSHETGVIYFDVPLVGGAGTVQVQWTGGLGANLAAIVLAAPQLVEGASLWAATKYLALRRQGMKAKTFGRAGGEVYDPTEAPTTDARALLDPYRCTMSRADV